MQRGLRKKGQSAAEFMIIVGMVMLFLIIMLIIMNNNISDQASENRDIEMKRIATIVQNEIKFAHTSTDGYQRNFTIPLKIIHLEYDINLTENTVYVRTPDGKHATSLPIQPVTGEIKKGDNSIKKELGTIYLNQ